MGSCSDNVRFITALHKFSRYGSCSSFFTSGLSRNGSAPANHVVLDCELASNGGLNSLLDSWWTSGTPRYFVLRSNFSMVAQLYPPNSFYPQPKISYLRGILHALAGNTAPRTPVKAECVDQFDAKYGAGYCSERAKNLCQVSGFKINCQKTCNACRAAAEPSFDPLHPAAPACEDAYDKSNGKGYCAARVASCGPSLGFRLQCRKTCHECLLNQAATPIHRWTVDCTTQLNTGAINIACPTSPGLNYPTTCPPSCAKAFLPFYNSCARDPRIVGLDARLHGALKSLYGLCARVSS